MRRITLGVTKNVTPNRPIREGLKKLNGQTTNFVGTFNRTSYDKYSGQEVALFTDVKIKDSKPKEITDHVWVKLNNNLRQVNLEVGMELEFNAQVGQYIKKDVNKNIIMDYCLQNIKDIKILMGVM